MTYLRPFRISGSDGGGYSVVYDALGRIVAQGRHVMCERIVAGLPLFSKTGSLLECS